MPFIALNRRTGERINVTKIENPPPGKLIRFEFQNQGLESIRGNLASTPGSDIPAENPAPTARSNQ